MKEESFSLSMYTVSSILGLVKANEIAIPEIQRPFVWKRTQVRDLIDSLYKGYPTGYLITWKNHNVRLKNGEFSTGKTILIDGQQRVTALMTALLGKEVIDQDYKVAPIKIAFNPENAILMEKNPDLDLPVFDVQDSSHIKSKKWIEDISAFFVPGFKQFAFIRQYCEDNPDIDEEELDDVLSNLTQISNRQIGIIELKANLDIDIVTDIFIRINSKGTSLSQGDFVMSKIASDDIHGGALMRKAIDYYAHLSKTPEFINQLKNDKEFVNSEYFPLISWLKDRNEDVYDPTYDDIIRVAFMLSFDRAKLKELVGLLSGRNFETKSFEIEVVDDTYIKLKKGLLAVFNKNNFNEFIIAIKGAGFISPKMISSQMALDFAYTIYLKLKQINYPVHGITHIVQRWYVLSILTGKYTGSPESAFYSDLKEINEKGIEQALDNFEKSTISDIFWDNAITQKLSYTSSLSPVYNVYLAAQVKDNETSLLSNNISVAYLIGLQGDVHHIFPKDYLKKNGYEKGMYNQVGNFAYLDNLINKSIGNDAPDIYFSKAFEQCNSKIAVAGSILDREVLLRNLKTNCIPEGIDKMTYVDYERFLENRRLLMAHKIRDYYFSL